MFVADVKCSRQFEDHNAYVAGGLHSNSMAYCRKLSYRKLVARYVDISANFLRWR